MKKEIELKDFNNNSRQTQHEHSPNHTAELIPIHNLDHSLQGNAKQNVQENTTQKEKPISFLRLFRFASKKDWALIILAIVASIINGAAMPLFSILFGDVADDFSQPDLDAVVDSARDISLKMFGIGIGSFLMSYCGFACLMISGERQAIEIRKMYFKSLLNQEIAFFDSINPNELSTKIAEECFNIQGGIGEKISTFLYSLSMFFSGFIIGYIKGWQLALIITGFLPFMIVSASILMFATQKAKKIGDEAYSKAGGIAEEVLNAIRTVVSLGGQKRETERYKQALESGKHTVVRFIIVAGLSLGLTFFCIFGIYALGFFIGSVFINNEVVNPVTDAVYSGGDVLAVFFSIVMAGFSSSQASPALKAFAIAKTSGAKAFQLIDRVSKISAEDSRGIKEAQIEGNIHFRDVTFCYPLKPDKVILDNISFDIKRNEKTALVGESGCGKTTCMQLIERFYDINQGSIKLDNYELKDLNLKWLRENIGYVGQEPVLFATSIKENLLMAKENATDDEIWKALKKANASDFVSSFPDKLNTLVGNNGAQLSGGQKQRLAIARAILKNPKILLLDEATSALDRKNELEIQKTLDEISEGRTTIIIAHRLTTIQNADHIIVLDKGKVAEEGRHEELIARKGRYFELQHLQLQAQEKKDMEKENVDTDHGEAEVELPIMKKSTSRKLSLNQKLMKKTSTKNEKEEARKDGNYEQPLITTNLQKEIQQQGVQDLQKRTTEIKGKTVTKSQDNSFKRLFKFNTRERPLLFLGILVALVNGVVFPCMAILLSTMLEILSMPWASDFTSRANLISLLFLILAIVALVVNAIQMILLEILGQRISKRVRIAVFQKYQNMPISWFDLPDNSPGALAAKLATDANLVNSLASSVLGVIAQALSSFVSGMVISLVACWQLTLISLAFAPLMFITARIQAKYNQGFSEETDSSYQESASFVAEAVNNMRTVASFAREGKIIENYSRKLDKPLSAAVKRGNGSGLAFGFSQLCNFGIYACVFYIGAVFIRDINLGFQEMLQSMFGIIFAAMGTGNAFQFGPDIGAAKSAADSVFKILDEVPSINIDDPSQTVKTPIKGDIEFVNVSFKYPTRKEQIFKDLSFKINASSKVALVGPSGCGKSTVLALLQRFYDVEQGQILIDGVDIKKYDLRHLRQSYGVVSQEPVLFNGTIEENIK